MHACQPPQQIKVIAVKLITMVSDPLELLCIVAAPDKCSLTIICIVKKYIFHQSPEQLRLIYSRGTTEPHDIMRMQGKIIGPVIEITKVFDAKKGVFMEAQLQKTFPRFPGW